jgi:hypothetical protein
MLIMLSHVGGLASLAADCGRPTTLPTHHDNPANDSNRTMQTRLYAQFHQRARLMGNSFRVAGIECPATQGVVSVSPLRERADTPTR